MNRLDKAVKKVLKERLNSLNEVDYEEIFSPETIALLNKKSKQSWSDLGKTLTQVVMNTPKLLQKVIKAEEPHRDLLAEIAKEIVTQAYPIIKQANIKIDAEIVGMGDIDVKIPDDEEESEDNDTEEIPNEKKRRIINGITQGASIRGTFAFLLFREYLDDLGEDMVDRYNELMKEVFGIFDNEDAIAMMLAQLAQGQKAGGGSSDAEYEEETGQITIHARALCFPMLVHEIVKGLYEILSWQGFTQSSQANQAAVNNVDLVKNEPRDFQYGKFIYDAINKLYTDSNISDARVRELFVTEIYKIDDETEFVKLIENLIKDQLTSDQRKWMKNTLSDIERDLKRTDAGLDDDYDEDEDDEEYMG